MGFTYTEEQTKVITLRNRNILVSAAAGSGKTTVLVERIIRLITDKEHPVDIDRLLVLTFTNAAAAEMRERIRDAIEKKLQEEPLNEHLQRQATLIHNALITTIHSFCLFLLKNHFHSIGLDPGFRVADEGELKLLKEEVLDELLEELFGNQLIDNFTVLADRFITGNSTKGLKEIILNVYHFSLSYPFAEEWLKERKKDYAIQDSKQIAETDWGKMLFAITSQTIAEAITLTQANIKLTEMSDGPYMYTQALESDLELLQKAPKCSESVQWMTFFNTISFAKFSPKKDEGVSVEKKEAAKRLRDMVKTMLTDCRKKYYSYTEEFFTQDMMQNEQICNLLLDTVLLFMERFHTKKQEKKLIDFSDMEHMALQILLKKENDTYVKTEIASEYSDYFKEIMIDEYQDSNLVQEWILKSISGEENGTYNRFMVGDVKQSIYKFRLACPQLFMEKYHSYQRKESKTQLICLSQNYRSRVEVIDSVNEVFSGLMGEDLGGVIYNAENKLYLGAAYPESQCDCTTELLLMQKEEKGRKSKQEQEATLVASRIKRLVKEFYVTDKKTGEYRKASYKDIVILLRTNSGWDEPFKRVLEKEGIPAYISSKTGYFQTTEIRDVMNFLRVLDNPRQDIPLYGTMLSVFGGFNEDEVALLRCIRKGDLIDGLKLCADGDIPDEIRQSVSEEMIPIEKCRCLWERIQAYREKVFYLPIHLLLRELFEETGYVMSTSVCPAGEQRKANVLMLLEKAEAYEKSSYQGLFHFIRYMEQLQKYEVDYGEASTQNEEADVVRIMSIHKSKGLEFPICFVCGLGKQFNMMDTRDSIIFDTEYGLAFDYVNLENRTKYKDIRKRVLAEKRKRDNLAEEIRVLYVAMTRAKEKLIMTALVEDMEKTEQSQLANQILREQIENQNKEAVLPLFMRLNASSYLDYVLSARNEASGLIQVVKYDGGGLDDLQTADSLDGQMKRKEFESFFHQMLSDEQEKQVVQYKGLLDYTYGHKELLNLYTKTSVSELKMVAMYQGLNKEEEETATIFPENERKIPVPRFLGQTEAVKGTTRGSAYHRVMELFDFSTMTQENILSDYQKQSEKWLENEQITKDELELVDTEKIIHFLHSKLAMRMQKAQNNKVLYCEQPFVLGVEAKRLSDHFPENETVLIQGIIDVYFIEDGKIVLMDYKTDTVKTEKELVERYHTQLDYYSEALNRITGLPVKEVLIYSFALQKTISVSETDCDSKADYASETARALM